MLSSFSGSVGTSLCDLETFCKMTGECERVVALALSAGFKSESFSSAHLLGLRCFSSSIILSA